MIFEVWGSRKINNWGTYGRWYTCGVVDVVRRRYMQESQLRLGGMRGGGVGRLARVIEWWRNHGTEYGLRHHAERAHGVHST